MKPDAETRGDIFPVWKKNPLSETLRAIEGSPNDKAFVEGYATFHLPTRITRQKLRAPKSLEVIIVHASPRIGGTRL